MRIDLETSPDAATRKAIAKGLDAYNQAISGRYHHKLIWLVGRDEAGAVVAGLKAETYWDCSFVQWLWVAEAQRQKGTGSALLKQAEDIAKARGCGKIYLDTFSFQAPEFYRRHGYREFGRIEDFPPGHSRIWFVKDLR